ncbi:MAG TPA: HutD family protein [Vicinamibacterales bacterium]
MAVHHFDRVTVPATPWKNGGGVTREIIRRPVGATLDDFEWRVSIATMAADGPFSPFPGVDRLLIVLDGAGVHLRSADGAIDRRIDRPLDPIAFPGEVPLSCRLLAGECTDFNVMVRREHLHASLEIVHGRGVLAGSDHGVLFSARGVWTADQHRIEEGRGISWEDDSHAWQVSPETKGAVLVAVRIIGSNGASS